MFISNILEEIYPDKDQKCGGYKVFDSDATELDRIDSRTEMNKN